LSGGVTVERMLIEWWGYCLNSGKDVD